MLKTIIVLPDGTELSSGISTENAIVSVSLTECVNDSQELTLGSTCANKLEAKIRNPGGNLIIGAGEEIRVYKADEDGTRHPVGLFTLEKPVRSSPNTMTITAYDRITWLDKDIAEWLTSLNQWPYSLYNFASMVCEACGLSLKNDSIPNGDYLVQMFVAQNITGRKIMQWIGQIAGRFCRATSDGAVEFAWYEDYGIVYSSDDRFYYQNGLSFEDYQVAPIEKVQLRLTENDNGVVWPNESGQKNTYIISGNYLLTANNTSALLPVAQTLYEQLKGVTFTPCKMSVPASLDVHAGHIVRVTDVNGKTFSTYVMTKSITGNRETLECTGSMRRDSSTAVNGEKYRGIYGQMLEIKKDLEGLSIRASKMEHIRIGACNLIRNSDDLTFDGYYFTAGAAKAAVCGTFVCGEVVCGQ